MLVRLWIVILLSCVLECTGLCVQGDLSKSCELDVGTIVGLVIGSIVAVILVTIVILLACSHLRYITGQDTLDYDDADTVISHNPSGATVITMNDLPRYPGSRRSEDVQENSTPSS